MPQACSALFQCVIGDRKGCRGDDGGGTSKRDGRLAKAFNSSLDTDLHYMHRRV